MRRKTLFTVILGLIMLLLTAVPAMAAEKINLSVNGESSVALEVYGQNGVSMIPAADFVRLAGADLTQDSDISLTINENDDILAMTVGKKAALLNGETVTMPAAPVVTAGQAYVPLRFAAEAFGFEVKWDEDQRLVLMNREETRDGFTPLDIVVKSGAATQDINTYKMNGNFKLAINAVADGANATPGQVNMDVQLKGQIQNDPLQVYTQQLIPASEETGMPEMAVETYMTTEKMYINIPEQGWVAQDMPFAPEFWQQQMDIQSNPIKAAQQMKEMGMFMSFGNDVAIGEQDYYAVNATLDMEKFNESMPDLMQQMVQGLGGQPSDDQNSGQAQLLQQMLEGMEMEYRYTVLVNKETLITDVIKLDARIKMDIEVPQTEETTGQQGPKSLKMDMHMVGDLNITDPGVPFEAPDVSDAKPATASE